MAPDLVSVMMPAYNAERYIGKAIDSLLAQTYPHWELVVVNDGSTDKTAEILKRYEDPRIRVFHQTNAGEACARNTALGKLRGTYLAFLDADDQFLPDHLQSLVGFLQSHPEYHAVYGDGFYINQEGKYLRTLSSRRRAPFEGDIFEQVVYSSDVFGAPVCVILSMQIISQNHLCFDPEIIIGPDWDFLTQYSEQARFGYTPEITCLYRVHEANISLRTGIYKRLRSLSRCREKAIRMKRFGECSIEARWFVFYDLLINLLSGDPVRQAEVIEWDEFRALPGSGQARLLRLMASDVLVKGENIRMAGEWLSMARKLAPADKIAILLSLAYAIHPRMCQTLLQIRKLGKQAPAVTSPFMDLFENN